MAMLTDDAPFKPLLLAPACFAVNRRHPRH